MRTLMLIIAAMLLSTSLQAQTISYRDRLFYTCKVWGLLKYHHSEVSTCKVDWDAVLLNTLPSVKEAEGTDAFNDVLSALLHAAGPMAPGVGTLPVVPEELVLNRDLGWLQDNVLRQDVRDSLQLVLNNFRPHQICHVRVQAARSYLEFPGDDPHLETEVFKDFPDESHRLLAMFTYWNILSWFNPNAGILDAPWDSTLHRNILDVAAAPDAESFFDAYRHMASALNDAHVNGHISRPGESFRVYGLKIVLGWCEDGYVVVQSDVPEIAVGDVLVAMDGKTVRELEEERRAVTSFGNPAVFRRDFCYEILKGNYYDPITLTMRNPETGEYTYSGKRNFAMNSSWHYSYYPCDSLADVKWKELEGGVGYVHMGNLEIADVPAMYDELRALPAIIFDVRNYPRGTVWDIADLIFPTVLPCVRVHVPDVTYPGTYAESLLHFGTDGNANAYEGKVIILCNAESQSHAEWTCMLLRAMPGAVIVGSQTAGADGNTSSWDLTKDLPAGFTSIGVYWPDGRQTQRIGIVPDSLVIPTREDIVRGRDPVLIKALQIAGVPVAVKAPPVPSGIVLEQNYPNPFNPSTTIRFSIPRSEHVRLVVTDMLGRRVAVLRDERMEAGLHEIFWDARGFPSGTYEYSLMTDATALSKTMTLIK